jgi:hypothetical protein
MTLYVALFGGSVTAVEKYGPGGHPFQGRVWLLGSAFVASNNRWVER